MKKHLFRAGVWFLIAMLVLTLASWKLDGLRRPQVVCVSAGTAYLSDGRGGERVYECVVPLQALHSGGGFHVYRVEETSSVFDPVVATRWDVGVMARDEEAAAVSGIPEGARVVLFSTRPLTGDVVTVRLWEEGDW